MLDHFGLLAPFYEKFIPPPDATRWVALLGLPANDRFPGRLLDAGGGTGRVSGQLRPFVDQLVISDVSTKMLAQAQAKSRCCAVAGHAETLPFAAGSFERIMVVDALHHFCNQAEAITDLARVLKPGGRLVIEEPDLKLFSVKLLALAEKAALMRSHFLYPHEIAGLLFGLGLKVRVEHDGRFAAWVIAEKR